MSTLQIAERRGNYVALIPLDRLLAEVPDWPFSVWSTRKLIRDGKLGHVKVGSRVFVTQELLDAFVREHTQAPVASGGAQ